LGNFILGLYGVSEWLADTDKARDYWKEGEGIIHHCLEKLSNAWFGEFIKESGGKWTDANEYRNRHLIKAISNRSLF